MNIHKIVEMQPLELKRFEELVDDEIPCDSHWNTYLNTLLKRQQQLVAGAKIREYHNFVLEANHKCHHRLQNGPASRISEVRECDSEIIAWANEEFPCTIQTTPIPERAESTVLARDDGAGRHDALARNKERDVVLADAAGHGSSSSSSDANASSASFVIQDYIMEDEIDPLQEIDDDLRAVMMIDVSKKPLRFISDETSDSYYIRDQAQDSFAEALDAVHDRH